MNSSMGWVPLAVVRMVHKRLLKLCLTVSLNDKIPITEVALILSTNYIKIIIIAEEYLVEYPRSKR